MTHRPAYALDEQHARELAGSYDSDGDDSQRDHNCFLLAEEAITDGILYGPPLLAVDRSADSDGDLDGYVILLHLADGYWIRSPIKRSSDFTDPMEILRDLADEANAMARLAIASRRPQWSPSSLPRLLAARRYRGRRSVAASPPGSGTRSELG